MTAPLYRRFERPGEREQLEIAWMNPALSRLAISRMFDCQLSTVRDAALRFNLPPRPKPAEMQWTDSVIALLRRLWAEGHSTAEIGRRMGLSKNAIIGKAHRLNLQGRQSQIKSGPRAPRKSRASPAPRVTLPGLSISPRKPGFHAVERTFPVAPRRAPEPLVFYSRKPEPCRFPIGDPRTPSFRYCDEPSAGHRVPYCAACLVRAYPHIRTVEAADAA